MATVYIESSVISYYAARPSRDLLTAAHQQITSEWWDKTLPKLDAFVSDAVLEEIALGDAGAAQRRLSCAQNFKVLTAPDEIYDLATEYYETIGIPARFQIDALHGALAVWHGIDYLVTWNCVHIAGARGRKLVQKINERRGLVTPGICTPEELMNV